MAPWCLRTFHGVIHQLLTAEGVFLVIDRKYVCCSQARFALGKEKCIHKWFSKAGYQVLSIKDSTLFCSRLYYWCYSYKVRLDVDYHIRSRIALRSSD